MAAPKRQVRDLNSLLDVIEDKVRADGVSGDVTVRDVMEVIGRRAYGPLLLLIGLISISPLTVVPGATWALALVTLVVSLQLLFHSGTPWLPKPALNMRLSETQLEKFIKSARPTARGVDKVIRPRMQFLADAPWVLIIALLCILAALITFPLGLIPFAPVIPGLAVVVFGLGLTARDGLLLALGAGFMGLACWLLFTRVF